MTARYEALLWVAPRSITVAYDELRVVRNVFSQLRTNEVTVNLSLRGHGCRALAGGLKNSEAVLQGFTVSPVKKYQ